VSLVQEEVATGGYCYQSGAGNAVRRWLHVFVGRQPVVGSMDEQGGDTDVF
jgi:hypothetical protein